MFGFDKKHFEKHLTRQINIAEGRRFLIYFLREEFGCTFKSMVKFCPALTNHATAMHHYNKMKDLLIVEKPTKKKYELFKNNMLEHQNFYVEQEILKKVKLRTQINKDLTNLKKLLK